LPIVAPEVNLKSGLLFDRIDNIVDCRPEGKDGPGDELVTMLTELLD